jgi:hypothetical protein
MAEPAPPPARLADGPMKGGYNRARLVELHDYTAASRPSGSRPRRLLLDRRLPGR